MFILAKRNLLLPSPDGSQSCRVGRGFLGEIPDWAAKTAYFSALVQEGKIVVTQKSDKATQAAAEKKMKTRRGADVTEE